MTGQAACPAPVSGSVASGSATLRAAAWPVMISLAVAGCVPFGPSGPDSYRDTDAPIGATTRFDAADFAGDWVLVASFDPIRQGVVAFRHDADRQTLTLTSDVIAERAGVYDISRAGVLRDPADPEGTLVVMWVDEAFRTAALGTVAGDFGVVLNRGNDTPGDRAAAAREVLAFYGWDISRLKRTFP
ncbi:hypothetical protein KX928_11740 [Roseobacter sp. YSTF-M11]|uniref:Lipocalin/cytosolic fatty-acid binding domain-containing protein n=1 Tax=Roseobacter insulae TaxID=2859783 RepID=A0A9X1FV00_9RHOB|nr:hypothetical protein [Roseobacter insulae]MBW4708455.1 hypothetical protein [Roseobacter insulae]